MKSRMMKKTLAVALSATMAMGMSVTAFAADTTPSADPSTETEAPIYSFDVTDVVVPTTFVTAFNPDELTVKKDTSDTTGVNDQVLSKNYGILNKSTKDKIVTVDLTVTDKNTDKIVFVDSDADATGAEKGEYAVHLEVVPADTTEVQVGGSSAASADKTTDGAKLSDVTMTPAAGKGVTLKAGSNSIGFILDKAVYTGKASGGLTMGDLGNDVGSKFELTGVAAAGKGITGFTFDGALNKNAEWTKLTAGIDIKAVYTFANAEGETPITGTGAMVELVSAPTFSSTTVGVINFAAGKGEKAFASLTQITAPWEGTPFDLTSYATVAADMSTITIDSAILGGWAEKTENPTATIYFKNAAGEDEEATVVLKTY